MAVIMERTLIYAMAEVWDEAWAQESEWGMPMQSALRLLATKLGEEFERDYDALLVARRGW